MADETRNDDSEGLEPTRGSAMSMIGQTIAHYTIIEKIGQGGMGEVYRARDTKLNRDVALKVLPENFARDTQRMARFQREAQMLASLNHTNIGSIYGFEDAGETKALVLELIEGPTLAERLKQGALPLDQALRYAIEIADALDKAHRQGVVHRDLKPGNIMLAKSGAKLLDFGLAKLKATEATQENLSALPTEQADLTAEGMILGTFQYMAPEQLEGKEADTRTDIFAFGSVLYEMLTGRRAFEGKSRASLISAIMSSEPRPISELQSMSPAVLDRIAKRCLEKDPDERWQTAKDLTAELRWVAERDAQADVSDTRSRFHGGRERWAWGVAVVTTIAAITLVATAIDRVPVDRGVTQFVLNPPEGLSFSRWRRGSPVVSPDGRHIAFSATDSAGQRIWVRSLDSLQARPLDGTDRGIEFFWSTDSRSIGFFGNGALRKVDVSGGPPQTLVESPVSSMGGTWNKEGVVLFSPAWSPIHRVRPGGETSDALTSLDASRHEIEHTEPQFLPDGEHFLFYVRSKEAKHRGTYVSSLAAPEAKRLILQGTKATYASPGYLLFAREGNLLAQRFDLDRLESVGEPIAVAEQVAVFEGRGFFSASTNGVLAYRKPYTPDYQLAWFDRRGNQLGILPVPGGGAQNPEISPDGKQFAFERRDPKTGTRDVWLFELARGIPSRFTFDPSDDSDPVWSPDGSSIAFSSGRDGYQSLYQKDANGSVEAEMIHLAQDEEWPMSWSPDGEYIIYNRWSAQSSTGSLLLLPLSGDRQPAPIFGSAFQELQAQFSPDGKWVSYASDESGRNEVYVQPFPPTGAKLQISTEGGTDARWRGDEREIFYLAPDRTLMAVQLSSSGNTLRPSAPRALFKTPWAGPRGVGIRFHYAVSHDGERFLIHTDAGQSSPARMVVVLNWTAQLEK